MSLICLVAPRYVGETDDKIGLELDRYDADGSTKHSKYFDAPAGRGYLTRRGSVSIVLQRAGDADGGSIRNEDTENDEKTRKRLIARTRKKLREIEVLEFKYNSGVKLHSNQISKMHRKEELQAKLEELKNGSFTRKKEEDRKGKTTINREKVRILARKTSIDWSGKYKGKQIVPVEVHDAVRVANGGTGVVLVCTVLIIVCQ